MGVLLSPACSWRPWRSPHFHVSCTEAFRCSHLGGHPCRAFRSLISPTRTQLRRTPIRRPAARLSRLKHQGRSQSGYLRPPQATFPRRASLQAFRPPCHPKFRQPQRCHSRKRSHRIHLDLDCSERVAGILRRLRHPDARGIRISVGMLCVLGGAFSSQASINLYIYPYFLQGQTENTIKTLFGT